MKNPIKKNPSDLKIIKMSVRKIQINFFYKIDLNSEYTRIFFIKIRTSNISRGQNNL